MNYDGVTVECPQCGKEFVARKPVPLIVCPACQGRVSVMAEACPHCGHPNFAGSLKAGTVTDCFLWGSSPKPVSAFFYVDWKYLVLIAITFFLVGFWIGGRAEPLNAKEKWKNENRLSKLTNYTGLRQFAGGFASALSGVRGNFCGPRPRNASFHRRAPKMQR